MFSGCEELERGNIPQDEGPGQKQSWTQRVKYQSQTVALILGLYLLEISRVLLIWKMGYVQNQSSL